MANVFRQNLQSGLQFASVSVAKALGDQYQLLHRGVNLGLFWMIPGHEEMMLNPSLEGTHITSEITSKRWIIATGQPNFPDTISEKDEILDPATNRQWIVEEAVLDSVACQWRLMTKSYNATRIGHS